MSTVFVFSNTFGQSYDFVIRSYNKSECSGDIFEDTTYVGGACQNLTWSSATRRYSCLGNTYQLEYYSSQDCSGSAYYSNTWTIDDDYNEDRHRCFEVCEQTNHNLTFCLLFLIDSFVVSIKTNDGDCS